MTSSSAWRSRITDEAREAMVHDHFDLGVARLRGKASPY
jgi:hypothetical protein